MFKNNRKPFKIHSNARMIMCTNFVIMSYDLSELMNVLCDAFIYAKRLTLPFTNPLVKKQAFTCLLKISL